MSLLNNLKLLSKISYKNISMFLKILGFAFILFLFPSPNIYFQPRASDSNDAFQIDLPDAPPIPVNVTDAVVPDITAQGVLIIDLPSDMILYQKNASDRFHPASTTKIITALVALDYYQLDDVLSVNRVEAEGRTMKLVSGEKLTFESLLYGALVHSANDAAATIAENYPGGVTKFVEAMNEKAKVIHLDNTHFTNPIGFDDNQMVTTPADLAKLARVALSNKLIAKIVGTKTITVSDISYTYFHPLTNVNELLGKIAGVAGVKTGYTENGGEILVSEVKKNERSVLFVILKSQDRFKETEAMIDWVFNNFRWKPISEVIGASR